MSIQAPCSLCLSQPDGSMKAGGRIQEGGGVDIDNGGVGQFVQETNRWTK